MYPFIKFLKNDFKTPTKTIVQIAYPTGKKIEANK